MKLLKNIWQWLTGSNEEIEEPAYGYGETVVPISLMRKYVWSNPKPRMGRRKISNIVRYR